MIFSGFDLYRKWRRLSREFYIESAKQKWMHSIVLKNRDANFLPDVTYYEFGSDTGTSLIWYMQVVQKICEKFKEDLKNYPIIVFDSFQGLPKPKKFDKSSTSSDDWREGDFSCTKEQLLKNIKKRRLNPSKFNLKFIEGFYEDSLTDRLRKELPKPSIVFIDCDYYSSTKTVLDWLCPILTTGTIFYFDDIWSFSGDPNCGEIRAINEFNQQNNGLLTSYPIHGMPSRSFIYSNGKSAKQNPGNRNNGLELTKTNYLLE